MSLKYTVKYLPTFRVIHSQKQPLLLVFLSVLPEFSYACKANTDVGLIPSPFSTI